jgi:hypothetical protein
MEEIPETEQKEIVRRGPKSKYENGYREHYKDIKYNLTYYYNHKIKIICEYCDKKVNKLKIREHQKSKKCINCQREKEKKNVE